ncbi:MAG: FkbM family methyltransferase [Planctomycetota bacterium]|nr:MAG: FkbM family methyltransferase [Planctomycetota bacterium]
MQKFDEFNRQKACRYGQMVYNFHDMYIGRSLDLYGEFSEGEVDLFRQILQPGNIVVEIGANIGAHTLFFAQQVTKTGAVIAFEPQRILFQTLCANMALNSVSNTYCFQQAVGAKSGAIKIPPLDYTKDNNFGGLALGSYEVGEQVPLSALDDFGFPGCHFLKIDVEGMEKDVLEGARNFISRFKPVLYVENDRAEKSNELVRLIDSLSYKMYWHRPPYYNPNNFFGNGENIFPNIVSLNMICMHSSLPHTLQGFEQVEVPAAGSS